MAMGMSLRILTVLAPKSSPRLYTSGGALHCSVPAGAEPRSISQAAGTWHVAQWHADGVT